MNNSSDFSKTESSPEYDRMDISEASEMSSNELPSLDNHTVNAEVSK